MDCTVNTAGVNTSNKIFNHALQLTEKGFFVFPLSPKTKIPLTAPTLGLTHGFKDAFCDAEKVRIVWDKYPTANIGIAMEKSKLICIDVDGDKGKQTLARIEAKYGPLPTTVTVNTPGKMVAVKDEEGNEVKDEDGNTIKEFTGPGNHYIYRDTLGEKDEHIKNFDKECGKECDVDVKGRGGYLVAVPSIHPDGTGTYEYAPGKGFGEIEIAELPEPWRKAIVKSSESMVSPVKQTGTLNTDPLNKKTTNPINSTGNRWGSELDNIKRYAVGRELEILEHVAGIPRKLLDGKGHPCPKCFGTDRFSLLKSGDAIYCRKCFEGKSKKVVDAVMWIQEVDLPEALRLIGEYLGITSPLSKITPVILSFDEIQEEEVTWLLQDVFPLGMVSVVAGKPGQGKSFLMCWVSAAVSCDHPIYFRGKLIPKGSVILCNAEDNPANTIKKRLRWNGADMTKVKTIPHVLMPGRGSGGESVAVEVPITLEMIGAFEQAFEENPDCRLLIVDPVSAFWGDTNDQKNAEVRVVISQLKKLAEKYNVAILLVTHLNKTASSDASSRITGSGGLPAAGRANWLLTMDETGLRTVSLIKTNVTENGAGFTFRVIGGGVNIIDSEVDVSADEMLQAEVDARTENKKGRKPEQLETATEWLEEFLKGGRKPVGNRNNPTKGTIYYEATKKGISARTLQTASEELGIKKTNEGRVYFWSLPEENEGAQELSLSCTLGNSCAPSQPSTPPIFESEAVSPERCARIAGVQEDSCAPRDFTEKSTSTDEPKLEVFQTLEESESSKSEDAPTPLETPGVTEWPSNYETESYVRESAEDEDTPWRRQHRRQPRSRYHW